MAVVRTTSRGSVEPLTGVAVDTMSLAGHRHLDLETELVDGAVVILALAGAATRAEAAARAEAWD